MSNLFEMLGAAFFLALGLMSILWVIYFFKRNAGIVDVGWAFSFVLIACAYGLLGGGYAPKRWILVLMVVIWGLRLAAHLWRRYQLTDEDPRYQTLRKNWGEENSDFKFYMMFIFQGVLVVFLSIPFLIVSADAVHGWQAVEVIGVFAWLAGVCGEALADKQLFDFKQIPENKGRVCREGLWYYSRHPNYFFEMLVWVGYFLFALGTPGGWLSLLPLGLMLGLLLQGSGIPLAEAQALKTKGDAYAEYQRTTNAFIPWFPKK